jgi:hypothetical protein
MKKISPISLTLIAVVSILFSILPVNTALAMKDAVDVTLKVRNRTGGKVTVMLINEDGNRLYFDYVPGLTNTALPEGIYRYYASTSCGNQGGEFNLNVTKQLFFACGEGLAVELTVPVSKGGLNVCYSVFDYIFLESSNPPFEWGNIGTYCQRHMANSGDTIRFYNPFWDETPTYYYEPDGIECFQSGNGYYYKPCPPFFE